MGVWSFCNIGEKTMEDPYRSYRKWLERIECKIRMRLPGWNVEIREHRPGSFEIMIGKPDQCGGEKLFYLTREQLDRIEESENFTFCCLKEFEEFLKKSF